MPAQLTRLLGRYDGRFSDAAMFCSRTRSTARATPIQACLIIDAMMADALAANIQREAEYTAQLRLILAALRKLDSRHDQHERRGLNSRQTR